VLRRVVARVGHHARSAGALGVRAPRDLRGRRADRRDGAPSCSRTGRACRPRSGPDWSPTRRRCSSQARVVVRRIVRRVRVLRRQARDVGRVGRVDGGLRGVLHHDEEHVADAGTPSALTQVVPDAVAREPGGARTAGTRLDAAARGTAGRAGAAPRAGTAGRAGAAPELEPLEEPELPPELDPLLLEPLDDEPPPSPPEPAGLLPEPPHAPMMRAARAHDRRAW